MLRVMGAFLRFRPRAIMRALGPAAAVAVERLARLSGRKIGLALLYHRVAADQGDPVRELVPPIGAALFEAQMRHVARHYTPVRAADLTAAVAARRRGGRFPVAVTFDDDDPNHTALVLPILDRTGVPATFFLNCASLERPTRFWWQHLQAIWDRGEDPSGRLGLAPAAPAGDPKRLHEVSETIQAMPPDRRAPIVTTLAELAGDEEEASPSTTREDIAQLERGGHELGWHTLGHEPLPTLADGALAEAVVGGRDRLPGAVSFAYPHGLVDDRAAAAVGAAGFRYAFTTHAERITPRSDPLRLGRLLPSFDSAGHFSLQLARRLVRSDG
jgi:peptidoglycan/xylan/chitin deacetylase (PgdA/CDA1 family)